jgi:hypothetical protein
MIAGVRSEIPEMSMTGGHGVAVYAWTSDANSVWVCVLSSSAQSCMAVIGGRPSGGLCGAEDGVELLSAEVGEGSWPWLWRCDCGRVVGCLWLGDRYLRACGLELPAVL